MRPVDIEVLIYCHVSPSIHPRIEAPAVQKALMNLEASGLIEREGENCYHTTSKGTAHISILCSTPLPTPAWVDQNGKVI